MLRPFFIHSFNYYLLTASLIPLSTLFYMVFWEDTAVNQPNKNLSPRGGLREIKVN